MQAKGKKGFAILRWCNPSFKVYKRTTVSLRTALAKSTGPRDDSTFSNEENHLYPLIYGVICYGIFNLTQSCTEHLYREETNQREEKSLIVILLISLSGFVKD